MAFKLAVTSIRLFQMVVGSIGFQKSDYCGFETVVGIVQTGK